MRALLYSILLYLVYLTQTTHKNKTKRIAKRTKESTCLIKKRKICHRITMTNDTEKHAIVCALPDNTIECILCTSSRSIKHSYYSIQTFLLRCSIYQIKSSIELVTHLYNTRISLKLLFLSNILHTFF